MGVHDHAAKGYQQSAAAYQRGRPDYSPLTAEWLRDDLGITSKSKVVDVGAGTGKFTQRLIAVCDHVSAVEPVAAMRDQFAQNHPVVPVIEGTSTDIPFDNSAVDVLICAQAFHWFANKQSLEEIRRVLKPGGKLGLIWNVRDETVDWVHELTKIVTPFEGDAPRYYKGDWKMVFPADGFTRLQTRTIPHSHAGDPEDVIVRRFMSVSFIASQPENVRAQIEGQIRDLIATHPALRDRQEVSFPYRTECFWCEKTG